MLMDINTLTWSEHMLKEFQIDVNWLPKIHKNSNSDFGTISSYAALNGVMIGGVLGD
jgi:glycerol kinase